MPAELRMAKLIITRQACMVTSAASTTNAALRVPSRSHEANGRNHRQDSMRASVTAVSSRDKPR